MVSTTARIASRRSTWLSGPRSPPPTSEPTLSLPQSSARRLRSSSRATRTARTSTSLFPNGTHTPASTRSRSLRGKSASSASRPSVRSSARSTPREVSDASLRATSVPTTTGWRVAPDGVDWDADLASALPPS
eukprot:2748365-Prymnesium_polylepis.1